MVDVGGQLYGAIGWWDIRPQEEPRASDDGRLQCVFSDCSGAFSFCCLMCRYVCATKGLVMHVCAAPGGAVHSIVGVSAGQATAASDS